MQNTKLVNNVDDLEFLKDIVISGGPNPEDYEFIRSATQSMRNNITVEEQLHIYSVLNPVLNGNSLVGHTFNKPYGYAGDFELIERIYSQWLSPNTEFKKWDKFYQSTDSAIAVRNRKSYLIKAISKACDIHNSPKLLNVGSGPCTELKEFFDRNTGIVDLSIDCVDIESRAIDHAYKKLIDYPHNLKFIRKNILRFKTSKNFDLIWSAGLFDYLDDRKFIYILSKLYSILALNGELIIGNFGERNPSRGLMEVICQWYLIHRSKDKLTNLAMKAGIPRNKIRIGKEPRGINLFMHLSK